MGNSGMAVLAKHYSGSKSSQIMEGLNFGWNDLTAVGNCRGARAGPAYPAIAGSIILLN